MGKVEKYVQIETLVPVGVQGSLGDRGRFGLLAIDCSNGEGVRKPYESLSAMIQGSQVRMKTY